MNEHAKGAGGSPNVTALDSSSLTNTPRAHARPKPPRVALRPEEAAAALGISRSMFDRDVLPRLRVYRVGRLKLVGLKELERHVEENSAVLLESERR